MKYAVLAVFAIFALAAATDTADARYLRGGYYSSGGLYGSVYGGGVFGGPWGWYGERRGFYGGFGGAYYDGAQVRPVYNQPYDESRCENIFTKVVKKGVARTRQIYRCR